MKTYSYGCTPESVIRENLPDSYNMELNGGDYEVFAKLVNIGIDSRLQAVNVSNDVIRKIHNKAGLNLDQESMVCLLNRCLDYGMTDETFLSEEEKERALDLRSGILTTIDIEEI
jgi:hypothetical protein